ncbi:hypothetical protein [Mesorhizobium sp. WSM3868]|nr:hypothetical protein [Mesorhizobium sp. WSM3868]
MMDKDGNPTELEIDAVTLLAGDRNVGWYEIDVREESWERPTFH